MMEAPLFSYLALPQSKNQFSGPIENGRRVSGLTLAVIAALLAFEETCK